MYVTLKLKKYLLFVKMMNLPKFNKSVEIIKSHAIDNYIKITNLPTINNNVIGQTKSLTINGCFEMTLLNTINNGDKNDKIN